MQAELEMLISTTGRSDLAWLDRMFPGGYGHFSLLIINQSEHGHRIDPATLPANIRIINQEGKGLSRSRNTALKHARGKILMIADDDVAYMPGFHEEVIRVHRQHNEPVIIFPFLDENGVPWGDHRPLPYRMKDVEYVYSPQISFKRHLLDTTSIRFNEHFGLGTSLPDLENRIFLTQLMRRSIPILYAGGQPIGKHPQVNSSFHIQRPGNIKARLAMYKLLYGAKVYPYFVKLMFFLLRKRFIAWKDLSYYWRWIKEFDPAGVQNGKEA